ncbi:MAG: cation:proton antiporter [Pikeienuella sp.]|uniref:cation:proton antiporter n=1 Tax=Pikeienuella sp. TaxID=2831957 RepID=UPI00391D4D0D
MLIVHVTAVLAALFLLIGLAEPLAERLRLPYTVILALFGSAIGAGAAWFLATPLTDALNPVAEAILGLPIRSNVFLYLFLPTLIFQVTLGVNLRRMLDDWAPIMLLAVVAVVVATVFVGYALSWATALPLAACLLIGAIVSTTDPSAVVGIFRSIAAPRRLSRIIEGESLLNDAAAIALFGLFISFVIAGLPDPSLLSALGRLPALFLGGAAIGWALALAALWLMRPMAGRPLAQVSISVALPYLSYLAAEQVAGASGVIAVVAAGLTLNLLGPGRLPPAAWTMLRETWDLLAHWAGALIFLLAAILIPRLLGGLTWADVGLTFVVVIAAVAARAAVLFGLLPLLTVARLSPPVSLPYRSAILWGGLRGAVTLALALAVTENLAAPPEVRRLTGVLATGFTLFTLIVQGGSLRWVIARLGLDRLSPLDTALANQVVAVALQEVREDMAKTTEEYGLSREIVRSEAKAFGERLEESVRAAEDGAEILDRDRVTLGLIAMAGAERELILERFRERAISSRLADRILTDADRLIEQARAAGRFGYRRAARRSLEYGPIFRLTVFLRNRLRLSYPIAIALADRFETLLIQRLILRDLDRFIDQRIRRIHGRRVADILRELAESRTEEVERALDGLRLQFPGYAEELERRFIRRTALRLEEREYEALREDGLIGAELHGSLVREVESVRARLDARPPLDVAIRQEALLRQFPFFSELEGDALRNLNRALKTRFVQPGEILMRRDSPARSVFFIASGAVEIETAGQVHRLGRGEMFGQIAILSRRARRSEARAITHTTLRVLDEARFRRLLRRSAAFREAVEAAAAKRGMKLDLSGEETAP